MGVIACKSIGEERDILGFRNASASSRRIHPRLGHTPTVRFDITNPRIKLQQLLIAITFGLTSFSIAAWFVSYSN